MRKVVFVMFLLLNQKAFCDSSFTSTDKNEVASILIEYLDLLKGCAYKAVNEYKTDRVRESETVYRSLKFESQYKSLPGDKKSLIGNVNITGSGWKEYWDENDFRMMPYNINRSAIVTLNPSISKSNDKWVGQMDMSSHNSKGVYNGTIDFESNGDMIFKYSDGDTIVYKPESTSCSFVK